MGLEEPQLQGQTKDRLNSPEATSIVARIILADADSDRHHIATLLLTFLYRHLPQLSPPAESSSPSRRSTGSISAKRPIGRSTTRIGIAF